MTFTRWRPPARGALFVVTGPSGTGKTTLVKAALNTVPGINFSVSATTRAARKGETHGKDYLFIDRPSFDSKIAAGDFLEWADVYGNRYGTLKSTVEEALNQGQSILLDIDDKGAAQVRAAMPEAISIFVLPPSIETIEARLRARATDSEDIIVGRIAEARARLAQCADFDYLLINDDLSTAHQCFQAILIAELQRRIRRLDVVEQFTPQ